MTSGMPYSNPGAPPYPDEGYFIQGVMLRRIFGWVIDAVLIAILLWCLWWAMLLFGLLTLGLGFGAMAVLPFVPFCYNLLFLLGAASATPGQRLAGLTVRRDADLGPPTGLQAVIFTVVFYLTLATSGLLLVVALFTTRHRTLHDLASGLVVVRTRAMEALTQPAGHWNMGGGTSGP
ncbi:MAG TPA: RDD family protein [Acetobacteraceae bacterium]